MTCPGCGAPDDQGCRKGCPEIQRNPLYGRRDFVDYDGENWAQPRSGPTLEEAFTAGYELGAGRAPWEDPKDRSQLSRAFEFWLRSKA